MDRDERVLEERYHRFALRVDDWTLAIAMGCLAMLIITQGLLRIPAVRTVVDSWRSGFVAVTTTNHNSTQTATVQLSLAPTSSNSDIAVLVDGKKVADFSQGPIVNISVQLSQHITIQNQSSQLVYVTVNDSDASLAVPAPGQRVVVSPNSLANFPAVQFQNPSS